VRGVLLKPLVTRDENRLVYIRQSAPSMGEENTAFSVPEIKDIEASGHSLSEFGDVVKAGQPPGAKSAKEKGEIMAQYLVAIHHPDNYDPSKEGEAMVRDTDVLNEEMEAAGARFFAGGLSAPSRAKSLRAQLDGKVLITDGPYLPSTIR
jgi:hypothetical protein